MRIQSTKDISSRSLKILVYGPPGIGKTTLAKTTGESTFVLSFESGLLSLSGEDIDYFDASTDDDGNPVSVEQKIENLKAAYKYLKSPEAREKYQWVVIDSLSEIAQTYADVAKRSFPDKKDAFQLWGQYTDDLRAMIKAFRDLSGYNVVMTALSESDKDEVGRRFQNVMMQGKIANQLPGYFDMVFYYAKATDENGEERRVLITDTTDKAIAKDRSGKLDFMEQPILAHIASKIRGEKK